MAERNIEQQYQDDNYRIDDISEIKRVLILCTSNGGWKENTYEWENLTQNPKIREYFGKIVFLRDVYRHFYIEGLNPRINCIDAIVDVLKEKIRGGVRHYYCRLFRRRIFGNGARRTARCKSCFQLCGHI